MFFYLKKDSTYVILSLNEAASILKFPTIFPISPMIKANTIDELIMQNIVINLSFVVQGWRSPYPTDIIVVNAQYSAVTYLCIIGSS